MSTQTPAVRTPQNQLAPRRGAAEPGAAPRSASFSRVVRLIARREITSRLRSKAFITSFVFMALFVLVGTLLPLIFGLFTSGDSAPSAPTVAVSSSVPAEARASLESHGLKIEPAETSGAAETNEGTATTTSPSTTDPATVASLEQKVRDGAIQAGYVADPDSPTGVRVIATQSNAQQFASYAASQPAVQVVEKRGENGFNLLAYASAIGFGVIYFVSAQMFGQAMAQSVVEEKQTRVVEMILATASPRAILAGKVLGNSILAVGQTLALAIIGVIGMTISSQGGSGELLGALAPAIAWFVVFFALGFVLVAALFGGMGALVSRQEDVASATAPVLWLIMIPYFLIIFFFSNDAVLRVLSFVPIASITAMPQRIATGGVEWWEVLASLAIMLVATVLAVLLSARLYENSILRVGKRIKITEALKQG